MMYHSFKEKQAILIVDDSDLNRELLAEILSDQYEIIQAPGGFADLRGLPPTLVQVGTNEILKSDSERLVENLQKAGVYAQLEVYPECWHVFQQMPIRRAAVAMESAGRFVQRII